MVIMQPALTALELNIFQKKLKKFIGNKKAIPIIYRLQANDSIMCRYFCVGYIDFMLKGKSLLTQIYYTSITQI